jgi:Zinc finger, C3HC4 type (RING finger)
MKVPNTQPRSVQTSASRTLLDLDDVKDATLVPKTLEAILKAGISIQLASPAKERNLIEPDCEASSMADSESMLDDRCSLCYEQPLDCVLVPCGHQMCCSQCGKQLRRCPVCKVDCSVQRVFRQ